MGIEFSCFSYSSWLGALDQQMQRICQMDHVFESQCLRGKITQEGKSPASSLPISYIYLNIILTQKKNPEIWSI